MIGLDSETGQRICMTLLHSLWQVALLALAAWIIQLLLGRKRDQISYLVHVTALVIGLIALPTTYLQLASETALPTTDSIVATGIENVPPQSTPGLSSNTESTAIHLPAVDTTVAQQPQSKTYSPAQSKTWQAFIPWVVGLYVTGVLLMLFRLIRSAIAVERLRSAAQVISDGPIFNSLQRLCGLWSLTAAPALAHAEHVVVPKVVGLLKPTILLPTAAVTGMATAELELILAHELAHVRRYDLWVNLLQRIAEAVLFFNPALWWLSCRVSVLREYCCDDRVCSAMPATSEPKLRYAEALLRTVELQQPDSVDQVTALAATGRSPSELRRRIARLFGESLEHNRVPRGAAIAVVSIFLLCFVAVMGAEVAKSIDDEKPIAQIELEGPFAKQAGKILDSILRENRLPFHTSENIDSICQQFNEQIQQTCQQYDIDASTVSPKRRSAILTSLRDRGAELLSLLPKSGNSTNQKINRVYLGFPDRLQSLQWKIAMALNKPNLNNELSDEQQYEQEQFLAMLQRQIGRFPETQRNSVAAAKQELQSWFKDPLRTTFDQPIADVDGGAAAVETQIDDFVTQSLKGIDDEIDCMSAISKTMHRIVNWSKDTLWHRPNGSYDCPLVTKGDVVGTVVNGRTFHLNFKSNRLHAGHSICLQPIEDGPGLAMSATTGAPVSIHPNVEPTLAAVEKWASDNGKGDFTFSEQGLVALRGGKLIRLDAQNWPEVDAISNFKIRNMAQNAGKPNLPVTSDFAEFTNSSFDSQYQGAYFAILTGNGEIATFHLEDFHSEQDVAVRVRPRILEIPNDDKHEQAMKSASPRFEIIAGRALTDSEEIQSARKRHPERLFELKTDDGASQWLLLEAGRKPIFTEHDVELVQIDAIPDSVEGYKISFDLNEAAGVRMTDKTSSLIKTSPKNVSQQHPRLVCLLDGEILVAPKLQSVLSTKISLTGIRTETIVDTSLRSLFDVKKEETGQTAEVENKLTDHQIVVEINKAGEITVDGQQDENLEALFNRATIAAEKKNISKTELTVTIKADSAAPYKLVLRVLEQCQAVGLRKFSASNIDSISETAGINKISKEGKPRNLIWGDPVDGLQAAIELVTPARIENDPTTAPGVPLGTKLDVIFHVKNVAEHEINFVSEMNRQGDNFKVLDSDNKPVDLTAVFQTGRPIDKSWNLKPGQTAKLKVLESPLDKIKNPGEYSLRYIIRFNSRVQEDENGKIIFPAPGDYQKELPTGKTIFFLRESIGKSNLNKFENLIWGIDDPRRANNLRR